MSGKLRGLSYGQVAYAKGNLSSTEIAANRWQRAAGLTPTCTLFVRYLLNEGVCPTLNPIHLPAGIQKAGSCLSAAPDPFTSKFNERTNKKLSRSCWQSAATQEPPPLPPLIPAPPQQHPSPEPSHPTSQPINLWGSGLGGTQGRGAGPEEGNGWF